MRNGGLALRNGAPTLRNGARALRNVTPLLRNGGLALRNGGRALRNSTELRCAKTRRRSFSGAKNPHFYGGAGAGGYGISRVIWRLTKSRTSPPQELVTFASTLYNGVGGLTPRTPTA